MTEGFHPYWSPDGEPIELMEWAELFEKRSEDMSPESWWRKYTDLGDGVSVSTVWSGLNHNIAAFLGGAPRFWLTMVMGGEYDQYEWEYSSRAEALDDHERIIRTLREGGDPGEDREDTLQ